MSTLVADDTTTISLHFARCAVCGRPIFHKADHPPADGPCIDCFDWGVKTLVELWKGGRT